MKPRTSFFAAVVSVFVFCLIPSLLQAQPRNFGDLGKLPKLGDVLAITNLDESHLAVWYGIADKKAIPSYWDVLVIYAVKDGVRWHSYRESQANEPSFSSIGRFVAGFRRGGPLWPPVFA